MRARSLLAPIAAALLVFAACGGDDSSSKADSTQPSDASSKTTGGSATDDTTADTATDDTATDDTATDDTATDTAGTDPGGTDQATVAVPGDIDAFEPPSDPTLLVGDAPAEGLAALGFPEGWVLPDGGLDDIVGVEVSYEQGDKLVSTHHATAYRAGTGDPEEIAKHWAGLFSEALGVDTERFGTITGGGFSTVAWSSGGDVEPGTPKLEIDAISTPGDPSAPVIIKVEFTSDDATLPAVVLPLDLDPTLPGVDTCGTRRMTVDLLGYQDSDNPDRTPTYGIHWEGTCTGLDTFTAGLKWFRDNGRDAPEGTKSITDSVESEDGVSIEVSLSKLDDGNTAYSLTFTQQIPLD